LRISNFFENSLKLFEKKNQNDKNQKLVFGKIHARWLKCYGQNSHQFPRVKKATFEAKVQPLELKILQICKTKVVSNKYPHLLRLQL
jgi:hypothetical protein